MKNTILLGIIALFLSFSNFETIQLNNFPVAVKTIKEYGIYEMDKQDSFNLYWINLRKAIIQFDTSALFQYTNFPLTVKGWEDLDPIISISRNDFVYVFSTFLNTQNDITYENNLRFIELTQDVSNNSGYDESYEWQRVGDMNFIRVNDHWKLSLIYLNTKELNKRLKTKRK